jgi:hypothetical protein
MANLGRTSGKFIGSACCIITDCFGCIPDGYNLRKYLSGILPDISITGENHE